MMVVKRQFNFLATCLLFFSACLPSGGIASGTPTPQRADLAGYLTEIEDAPVTPTKTLWPTLPTKLEKTWTPTPTFTPTLTPYPTFDIADAIKATPAPPAVCPPSDPDVEFTLGITSETKSRDYDEIILEALQTDGVSLQQVAWQYQEFREKTYNDWKERIWYQDLTGDGIKELAINNAIDLIVFGCDSGEHKILLVYSGFTYGPPSIEYVGDMNLNGIPEVITKITYTTAYNAVYNIHEWDGTEFKTYLKTHHGETSYITSELAHALYWYEDFWLSGTAVVMNSFADFEVRDLDRNGTKELIIEDYGHSSHLDTTYNFGPWRGKKIVFQWDGVHFLYTNLDMAPPLYRFQAVQDADRFFFMGNFENALELYQDVIFSGKLDWWSKVKMQQLFNRQLSRMSGDIATPTMIPNDTQEYDYLAAYSRYRILLHHLARGWVSEAGMVNETLQAMFPPGAVDHEYAEMATLLWNSYQLTGSLEQACAGVIAYAESHPEILAPLGDKEHGLQSHIYVPADVCPFPWPPNG